MKPITSSTTILCIDDELPSLEVRKYVLETRGYKVVTASSADVGIRIFQTQKVDAVILDYWIVPTNGLAIAAQLKRLDPSVPIIMLSSFSTLMDESVGLAEAWILKGAEPEVILDKLDELLQKRSKVRMMDAAGSLVPPSEPENPET